ncbi:MAG: hypothetical protein ABR521_02705 [Gaiellaceae bacterium]
MDDDQKACRECGGTMELEQAGTIESKAVGRGATAKRADRVIPNYRWRCSSCRSTAAPMLTELKLALDAQARRREQD